MNSVCLCMEVLGVKAALVHLQDVVQPEEPNDMLKKNKHLAQVYG